MNLQEAQDNSMGRKFSEDIIYQDIDELVASLSDKSEILSALAVHARATSDPDANLTTLRLRLNRIRARLNPVLDPQVVVLSRSGLGFEKIASRLFSKEIIREGSWIHPRGGEVHFDAQRLAGIVSETNRYLESVGRIPMPDGHKFDAAPTLGWVHAVWLDEAPEGVSRILGLVEVHSAEIADKMGSEIRDVSMMLEREVSDSHGNTFRDVITHVAATPYPVIDVQATFEPLALSKRDAEVPVPILAKLTESQQACVEQKVPTLRGEGAKPDQAVAVAIEHCTRGTKMASDNTLSALGFAATDEPSVDQIEERVLALANERDEYAKKVESFEAHERERLEKEIDALVLSTREAAVEVRNPEAFGPDQEARVRRLWSAGDQDTAKELCSLYATPIQKIGDATVAVEPDAAQAARDRLDTSAARYAARGWRIEWAHDKSEFTRRKGDAVIVENLEG